MFSKIHLRGKMILLYVLTALLPIALIVCALYIAYHEDIEEKTDILAQTMIEQHELLIAERLQVIQNSLYEMLVDDDFISLVDTMQLSDATAQENYTLTTTQIYSILRENDDAAYIQAVAVVNDQGSSVYYSSAAGRQTNSIFYNEEMLELFISSTTEKSTWQYFGIYSLVENHVIDYPCIYISIPIYNYISDVQYGVLVVAVDASILDATDNSSTLSTLDTNEIELLIVDENDNIVAQNGETSQWSTYTEYLDSATGTDVEMYKQVEIEGTPWRLIMTFSSGFYGGDTEYYVLLTIIFTTVIVVAFLLVWLTLTGKYITSINLIAHGIKLYPSGQYRPIELSQGDELYHIAHQFNVMTHENDALIRRLEQKNIDIQEATNRQKKAEIKALEAQINPHFLYNTLDSINWMAIEHKEMKISRMISSLGSILRYSITNIDTVVSLEAEILWLQKYVFLQRERFNYSFDCMIQVDEYAQTFPIYKMLLQPIVENCILHGFEGVKEGGVILITGEILPSGQLVLSISDNGCGIDPTVYRQLQEDIARKAPINSDSIGVSNVINRLRIYYGDEATIELECLPECGTTVRLCLPNVTHETK